jgi:hypothetical protein
MANSDRTTIDITKTTREALAALKAEMRKRTGCPISYDEMISVLMDRYEGDRGNPIKGDE